MTINQDNEDVVRRFCEAFSRRDIEELLAYFTPDAIYHNIPFPPAQGIQAIRDTFELFVPGSPSIEFELINVAAHGSVVFTERIDRMSVNGNPVELPVAGVFEIEDGRIKAWRDYFDPQMSTTGWRGSRRLVSKPLL
jgi:limonene-1,2-epoxide hydrolase